MGKLALREVGAQGGLPTAGTRMGLEMLSAVNVLSRSGLTRDAFSLRRAGVQPHQGCLADLD